MTLLLLLTLLSGSASEGAAYRGAPAVAERAGRPSADTTLALDRRGAKRPVLAFALSSLNTVAPATLGYLRSVQGGRIDRLSAGLLAYGLVVGPAVGHLYAGNGDRAGRGVLVRVLGAGVAGLGAAFAVYASFEPEADLAPALSGALGFVGGGLLLGWAAYDIRTAPRSAVRHNARRLAGALAPQFDVAGRTVGLSLRLRF